MNLATLESIFGIQGKDDPLTVLPFKFKVALPNNWVVAVELFISSLVPLALPSLSHVNVSELFASLIFVLAAKL
jgi:hypothetical protein